MTAPARGAGPNPADRIVAVDIGGTKTAVGVVDGHGRLRSSDRFATSGASDGEHLWQLVAGLVEHQIGSSERAPIAIGVGCGGPNREMNTLVSPLNLPLWRNFPLRDRLCDEFGLPAFVDNDAKALALGEGWVGAARDRRNFLAMVVSTGVGGGIVLDGRLVDGVDGNAGHIGHVYVQETGGPDATGVAGKLEGATSGRWIQARTGRPAAEADRATRRRAGRLVGRAIGSTANLLDLDLAVVSGSVALGFGDDFFDAAQQAIDELTAGLHSCRTRVVPGDLGPDGPLIGAAAVAFASLGPFPIGVGPAAPRAPAQHESPTGEESR